MIVYFSSQQGLQKLPLMEFRKGLVVGLDCLPTFPFMVLKAIVLA